MIGENGRIVFDKPERDKLAAKYWGTVFAQKNKPAKWDFGRIPVPVNVFTNADLLNAIRDHNDSKAIGPDLLDSKAWKSNSMKLKFASQMATMLNRGVIPNHLKKASAFLLSKKDGVVCPIQETRCIQLLSHAYKIMEKAIYKKVKEHPVLQTGDYQTGFKEGSSCGTAQAQVLQMICEDSKRRKLNRRVYGFIDIAKAYDSVDRELMFKVID